MNIQLLKAAEVLLTYGALFPLALAAFVSPWYLAPFVALICFSQMIAMVIEKTVGE